MSEYKHMYELLEAVSNVKSAKSKKRHFLKIMIVWLLGIS